MQRLLNLHEKSGILHLTNKKDDLMNKKEINPESESDYWAGSGEYTYSINGIKSPEIILIGTAHVSEKSIAEVKEVIEREKPDVVAVELCKSRYDALKGDLKVKSISVKELIREGKVYFFLVHWLLSYIQRKIGSDVGVKPGAEMMCAIETAEKIGAQIALVDRDIQVSLQRFWSKMSFFEKTKMFFSLIAAAIGFGGKEVKEIDLDTVTQKDVVTQLVEELRQFAPTAAKVLVDERDAYIAGNLLKVAKNANKVVAVIGAGHREGIQKYLSNPKTIPPIQDLTTVPKKRFNILKIFGIGFVVLIITIFILLILSVVSGALPPEVLVKALAYWIVINGVLSALGVLLARGHIYSVLTAFGVAWLTSLNPFMAAGWFAGIVEAWKRKPSIDDLSGIMEIETFREMMQNKAFRVILVAALANIGSMIGTFIGAWVVLQLFGFDPTEWIKNALCD